MSDTPKPDESKRQRLDEAVAAFLVALDAGLNPAPSEWLARYPELHVELAGFFADRKRVDALVDPLRAATAGQTIDLTFSMAAGATTSGEAIPQRRLAESEAGGERFLEQVSNRQSGPWTKGTHVRYFGDYELERVLGEGGMGIVYKARQISLNRAVALKMIKAARFASADDLRRFQNEAEAVARLDHPNVVPIFEVGQFEDQQYFSMKFIAGESLDKKLKDYAGDPRKAAKLLTVTADAIHHAHQRGILHRDLKPANVLVDAEGQPHVTDFGLARQVEGGSEITHSGMILGTPAYMAPEQASGSRASVTTSTDVYGLGAILYALLTGRAPFSGTTVLDTLEQVRERPPESPRKVNPRVPRDLEVICLKSLEKDWRRRYVSAFALAEDLNRWLRGEPIEARPVTRLERALKWARRKPTLAAAYTLGLVAALLGGLGGTAAWQWRNAERARNEAVKARAAEQIARSAAENGARNSSGSNTGEPSKWPIRNGGITTYPPRWRCSRSLAPNYAAGNGAISTAYATWSS